MKENQTEPSGQNTQTLEPCTHRLTTMQQAQTLATGCQSLLFGLFWLETRGVEADHLLHCISIEPLLMDEQDDGKQKAEM